MFGEKFRRSGRRYRFAFDEDGAPGRAATLVEPEVGAKEPESHWYAILSNARPDSTIRCCCSESNNNGVSYLATEMLPKEIEMKHVRVRISVWAALLAVVTLLALGT